MPTPCVNEPLLVESDGSLSISGIRTASWPYSGAIGTYNGLAVDGSTGFGWAPPETGAAQWYDSAISLNAPSDGGNDRSGAQTATVASTPTQTITNNDVNRAALVFFIVTCDFDATTYGASIITVIYSLNIPAGTTYISSTSQTNQYLANSNSTGVGQHKASTFAYGYSLAAGASMTYNASCTYSISAIANASQVVTISMAARALVVHN